VARDDGFGAGQQAALGQFLMREEGCGDDKGLRNRRVGDLVGGCCGPQAGQIQVDGLGPRGDPVTRTGQFKPRRQHAGSLRSLSRSDQRKHGCLRHELRKHCETGFAWCKRL
jgi:hypothetical protein